MDKFESFSDEKLVSLHQQKRINAFFILYQRYRNYGYAIVFRTLQNYKLLSALKDDRSVIIYESIMKALASYNKERGTFRKLLSIIIERLTINEIDKFQKDPLSDYISIDSQISENTNFRFADSLTFADKEATPRDCLNLKENVSEMNLNYLGSNKRRTLKMLRLKEQGYTFKEIAKRCHVSEKSVRGVFYRLKRRIESKESGKVKK